MTREWAEQKTKEEWEKVDKAKRHLVKTLESLEYSKGTKLKKTINAITSAVIIPIYALARGNFFRLHYKNAFLLFAFSVL